LKRATGWPWTTTTRPSPGWTSEVFATRTNVVIETTEPRPPPWTFAKFYGGRAAWAGGSFH